MAWNNPVRTQGLWLLRASTLVLAVAHSAPASKHLAEWWVNPSFTEAWKGFGGLLAMVVYLMPVAWQAHLLGELWRRYRRSVLVGSAVLMAAHAVPAWDHLPQFFLEPSWAQAWRGFGSALAVVWFALPFETQARAVSALVVGRAWASHGLARLSQWGVVALAGVAVLVVLGS